MQKTPRNHMSHMTFKEAAKSYMYDIFVAAILDICLGAFLQKTLGFAYVYSLWCDTVNSPTITLDVFGKQFDIYIMFSVKCISEIGRKSAKIHDKTYTHISRLIANCQTASMFFIVH